MCSMAKFRHYMAFIKSIVYRPIDSRKGQIQEVHVICVYLSWSVSNMAGVQAVAWCMEACVADLVSKWLIETLLPLQELIPWLSVVQAQKNLIGQ